VARYCSNECQTAAWEAHKQVCKALERQQQQQQEQQQAGQL
jgi:hypothetical protein